MEIYTNPRLVAFQVLKEIEEKTTLEQAILANTSLLNSKDLALCTAIVYECVRNRYYLDFIAKSYLTESKANINLTLVLRIGIAQLIYFDRLKEHAIVMETVDLAKLKASGRHKVVNAVLRNMLRFKDKNPELWPPKAPEDRLDIKYSHPKWLVEKWIQEIGRENTEKLLIKNNEYTPPTIRVNTQQTSRNDLKEKLTFETEETKISPFGLTLKKFNKSPEAWAGYNEGLFALQDEASQLLTLLIEKKENLKILDACAGLGGKTVSLATTLIKPEITALDKDQNKLNLLKTEAKRLNCESYIKYIRGDLLYNNLKENYYDLVLLDAPCSGLGVIRRRPDLKWAKSLNDIRRLSYLQTDMLEMAAKLVKSKGQLIYSVCSICPEEGPDLVNNFLETNNNFVKKDINTYPEEIKSILNADTKFISLWPHIHNTDGFFWANLIKN